MKEKENMREGIKLYTLTHPPYLMLANKIGEVLGKEGIRHNIVGGAAAQGYVLSMLTQKYNTNIVGLFNEPDLILQDYIRGTDDIDMALKMDEQDDREKMKRINAILETVPFEAIDPNEQYIVELKASRIGASRPRFRVYIDSEAGREEEAIALNISRGRHKDLARSGLEDVWYDEFIKQSQRLVVPFNKSYDITMNVPRLEHLLSTKVSRLRAKDRMDISNLAALCKETDRKLDFREMERILVPVHTDKFSHFLDHEFGMDYNPEDYKQACPEGCSSHS